MALRSIHLSCSTRRAWTGLLGVLLIALGAHTASAQYDSTTFECAGPTSNPRDRLGSRALSNGYRVAITRDTADVEAECIGTLRDHTGKIARREYGLGARIGRATGLDIDGDKHPDLVLEMDTGGGNHCCWKFVVISLAPKAH